MSCTITRSLGKIVCPFCSKEGYLILKVRPSGRYYIAIMHRDGSKTEWRYIEPEEVDKVFSKEVQELIKSSVEKLLEEARREVQRKAISEMVRRKVFTFLAHKCRSIEDLENYLKILEGLAEVEKFSRQCSEAFEKGSGEHEDKTLTEIRRKCIELECGSLGWSYNALSTFVGFNVPGPTITSLMSYGIIEQTYRSRRSKYWKLTVDPNELSLVTREIREVIKRHGLKGLYDLFNRYIGKDTLEKFIERLIGHDIDRIIGVTAIILEQLCNLNREKQEKILGILYKLIVNYSIDTNTIDDEVVRSRLRMIISELKILFNEPHKKSIEEHKGQVKLNDEYLRYLLSKILYNLNNNIHIKILLQYLTNSHNRTLQQ